jgi:putative BNR repeat neuraminidase
MSRKADPVKRRSSLQAATISRVRRIVLIAIACSALAREPIVLNPDGAWCWFQDERALAYDDKLSVASIGRTGNVQVTTWDFRKGTVAIATLREKFPVDDHNVPGLLLRNDGRLMAFYTEHGGLRSHNPMNLRVSAGPRDAGAWEPEQSFSAGVETGASYANPFQLSAEHNRIYLFWRGIDFNPNWSASDDGGRTWSTAANHIYHQRGERPYVKYASNGVDTIHFAYTDGHPNRPYRNNLYHAYYRNGGLYRSDGTFVRKLAEGPLQVTEGTRIYDGASASGEAWVWDIHLDPRGWPVVVYTSHPDPLDQRYRYARWNGKAWEDQQIAYAGKRLYPAEAYYAGGIALDPDNLNTVYISSDVDISSGKPQAGGHYEISKGTTRDGGKTWTWTALTRNSTVDNLRPIVPAHHPGATFVLWYRGLYTSYTRFATEVVAYTDAKLPQVQVH